MKARCSNWLRPFMLFAGLLLYFVFGSGWQEPARLTLRGQATAGNPLLTVRWNSGAGFNSYEQRMFLPELHPLDDHSNNHIVIGSTGRKNGASLSTEVVCTTVIADGKAIKLQSFAGKQLHDDGELHFAGNEEISFTVKARSQIGLRCRTNTSSGIAVVSVNGKAAEPDLYMANEAAQFQQFDYWLLQPDNSFAVDMDLPRYPVRELVILSGKAGVPIQLTAAELHGKGQVRDLLKGKTVLLGKIRFPNALKDMRSFFHPLQFVQQICFALLSAWLLAALLRLRKELGGLRRCFLAEKRPWFWLMLAGSITVLGAWLAAFWPAVMSVDSLKVWRAAVLPDVYLNDHPFLNVILYKYLHHLWNDPAVVAAAHVFLTALLAAWFGFWLFRQGLPVAFVLLWLLFFLCSVPVGVYNLMLWKDIPFALLVVFWACLLAKLRQEKRQGRLRWTWQRMLALLLLGLSLGLVRHNGLVYCAALPALLLLLGLVPLKRALPALAGLLLAAGIGFAVLHSTGRLAGASFLRQELHKYGERLSAQHLADDGARMAHDYLEVLNINQTRQLWDKFHYYFRDRQAWWFLLRSGWWDVYPYQQEAAPFPRLRQAAMQLYEASNQEPWVWLAWNPVWLLALLPLLTLLGRWLPNTAVLGAVLLSGALPLIYLQIFNWRYYYFLYFGLLFLPAFVVLDLVCLSKQTAEVLPISRSRRHGGSGAMNARC